MAYKERTIIVGIENQSDNETVVAEPLSEYNGDWLRARRAEKSNDIEKVNEMKNNTTAAYLDE